MSEVQVYTTLEAWRKIHAILQPIWEHYQQQAFAIGNDPDAEQRAIRANYFGEAQGVGVALDALAAEFDSVSPAGPARPELVDTDSPRGSVGQVGRGAQNAAKHATRWAS